MYKPASTITGLYREDYLYNHTSPAFSKYSDVYREVQPHLTTLTNNGKGDSWVSRIRTWIQGVI